MFRRSFLVISACVLLVLTTEGKKASEKKKVARDEDAPRSSMAKAMPKVPPDVSKTKNSGGAARRAGGAIPKSGALPRKTHASQKTATAKTGTAKTGAAKLSLAEELKAVMKAIKDGAGNRKVAMTKLKRLIDNAKKDATVDAALVQEAEEQLNGQAKAEDKMAEVKAALQYATEAGEAAALEEAIKIAKDVGLPRCSELGAAEKAMVQIEKERKKVEKLQAKRQKTLNDLEALLRESAIHNVSALRNAISTTKALVVVGSNATEDDMVKRAGQRLDEIEWESLPRDERLQRTSSTFAAQKCRSTGGAYARSPLGACRRFSDDEMKKLSAKVGEKNCDHPTLKPDGPEPPQKNAASKESSKHFCKYPAPFDLQLAPDGDGYKMVEFKFPATIFDPKALESSDIADLAVVNLDMNFFRSRIAPCGTQELWLLEFYVHWCPHCQALMPKLFKLGIALRAAGLKVHLGAVNCAAQPDLCGAFQVMGHPMISFFYGGIGDDGQVKLFEYSGTDLRVNAALESLKKNADPNWFRGAPKEMPKHLFPAEMAEELIRHLPEDYRPSEAVLRWLGNGSKVSATECADSRLWFNTTTRVLGLPPGAIGEGKKGKIFPGNGWPTREVAILPKHRLQDAVQALVYTLEEWVVPNAAGVSPNGFAYIEIRDLFNWVRLLVTSFPSEAEGGSDLRAPLQSLRDKLEMKLKNVDGEDGQGAMCLDEWKVWVRPLRLAFDAARANQTFISTCRTETCRVWTLLHILTVAPLARQRETDSQQLDTSSNLTNAMVFDAMTEFLRRYFTCTTCRTHFLQQVEDGSYNLAEARVGGAKDLALWWWRLHTAVSARVAKEGKCKADRRWPPADLCETCWAAEGAKRWAAADEDIVADELVRHYWPRAEDEESTESVTEPETEPSAEDDSSDKVEL